MSKYPLWVEFDRKGEYLLSIKSVSYAKPESELFYKIDEEWKSVFFAGFGKVSGNGDHVESYNIGWVLNGFGNPASLSNIDDVDNNFPKEYYYDLMWVSVYNVIRYMLDMHDQVGDIWKMPDPLDCFLYAQTEASEYLESVLLQVRSTDSRNNKQVADYDTATEMFDVTMMLLRGLIAHFYETEIEETNVERTNRIIHEIRTAFSSWKANRLHYNGAFYNEHKMFLENEPESLGQAVNDVIIEYRAYLQPETLYQESDFENMVDAIFVACFYVIFHPVVQYQDYDKVAEAKLLKILNKSLAKKSKENV